MKELNELLHSGIVEIVFTKVDGSARVLKGTLMESYLPEKSEISVSTRKVNANVTCVWDTENKGWRSFKNDSVVSYIKL
jgi:WYL_2, Sm-like SH3 beta-barrel fold